jgi:glycine/sarcosine N-methyltransferase
MLSVGAGLAVSVFFSCSGLIFIVNLHGEVLSRLLLSKAWNMDKNILPLLDFYDQLSDSYDQMISWPTRIGAEGMFFKKLVTDHRLKSSLDIACSTGFHVIMFRRLGLDAVGVDASPKMIDKAKANSITCGVTVECILGDFVNLSKRFSEGFDIITCLGDTIPHLKSKREIKKTFQEIYKCLNPGGLFVIQNRNYDYIVKNQVRFMPPTGSRNGTEETLFFRLLDFNPKSIDLSVVKFHRHENKWDSTVQTVEIYPYFKSELESLLKAVGFKKLDFYKNYNFEDYDKSGADLIIVAEKKGVLKSKPVRKRSFLKPEKVSPETNPPSVKTAGITVEERSQVPGKRSRGRPPKYPKS